MTIAIHVNHLPDEVDVRTHRGDPLEAPLDVAAAFTAGALLGVVSDWLSRGCPGTTKSMATEAWRLMMTVADAWPS